jgi:deoxyribose-phosphate aldolase
MEQKELDKVVEAITAKVRERLASATRGPRGGGCGSSRKEDCTQCGHCVVQREADTRNIISLGAVRVSTQSGISGVPTDLARYIDHTLLKQDATREQLRVLCDEARKWGFRTVCVNSSNVRYCKTLLSGCSTVPIAVVGFPLGAMSASAKATEARQAVRDGADEIDMVINVGELKSKNYAPVLDDIRAVVEASRPKVVKVIIESGGLTQNEKIIACALSKAGGAHFVKTSTGFGPGGATAEDIRLMKEIVGSDMEVKASGGIRTQQDALTMIAAGATRVGASASIAIVTGQKPAAAGKY